MGINFYKSLIYGLRFYQTSSLQSWFDNVFKKHFIIWKVFFEEKSRSSENPRPTQGKDEKGKGEVDKDMYNNRI